MPSRGNSAAPSVHPHMRGEYGPRHSFHDYCFGSPPHAWGIRHRAGWHWGAYRFTPTCVGNTTPCRASSKEQTVHPHMRGEYVEPDGCFDGVTGSPPHAWGIQGETCRNLIKTRFTPTCVGNTSRPPVSPARTPVHPHMRGEYTTSTASLSARCGSPPHAWGIHRGSRPRRAATLRGFTPTCVGNTRPASAPPPPRPVHPHMRGEYVKCEHAQPLPLGSPPHAWGIHCILLPRNRKIKRKCSFSLLAICVSY